MDDKWNNDIILLADDFNLSGIKRDKFIIEAKDQTSEMFKSGDFSLFYEVMDKILIKFNI